MDEVFTIEQASGDTHWSRAQFEKELSLQISRFFLLRRGCKIIGYGGYWKVGEEAQITNLVIVPRERRKGSGKALLAHILHEAKSEGCSRVTLEVRGQNDAAQALYRKIGFVLQGRRPGAYTLPEDDAVMMEKIL